MRARGGADPSPAAEQIFINIISYHIKSISYQCHILSRLSHRVILHSVQYNTREYHIRARLWCRSLARTHTATCVRLYVRNIVLYYIILYYIIYLRCGAGLSPATRTATCVCWYVRNIVSCYVVLCYITLLKYTYI